MADIYPQAEMIMIEPDEGNEKRELNIPRSQ